MHLNKINTNNINSLILDKKFLSKSNDLPQIKHYPPTNKEWFNSVYKFNKNYPKSLPITDIVINKLFKSYFYLTSSFEQHKIKAKNMRILNKRLSANRIYLSTPEIKHSNNKVIITLYTYNRTSFCNGLTISKKKIWIKKNVYLMKKFFSFGTLNLSKNFIISRIFSSIINPFDRLVKNKKNKNKNQYQKPLQQIHDLNALVKKTEDKKKNFLVNFPKKISSEKIIYTFNQVRKIKTKMNKKELYIIMLLNNILSIKNFSNNLSKFYNNIRIFNILKKLNLRKHTYLFNTYNKSNSTAYSNLIQFYRTNYKYNFFKTKVYLLNYKNKLKIQFFFGKFTTKFNNTYFKSLKYKLHFLKNKYFTLSERNEKFNLVRDVYFNNNQFKPKFNTLPLAIKKILLKTKQFKLKSNILVKNYYFKSELTDFKNTYFSNFKNKYLKNLYLKSLGLRNKYLNKIDLNFYNKKRSFIYTVHNIIRRFKINLYYKRKNSFINFVNYISYFKNNRFYNKNAIVLNRLKIIFNKYNNFVTYNLGKIDLNKFIYTFKLIKFKLENYKIIKFNLKKYNFIFELIKIKNPLLFYYFFKQLYKRRKFITYKKNVQSIWKIIMLKTDYKKLIKKIKLIDNSNLKNIVRNISLKLDSSKLNKFLLSPLFIESTSFTNKIKHSSNFSTLQLNEKKSIFLHQSNTLLKKRLTSIFPLYLYNLQMTNIHYYKYKDWFLIPLNNIMQNIYNKKIEFNFINLKYIYLSSDMFSESMAIKLKNRKNRILKVLVKALRLIKIPSLYSFLSTIDFSNKNKKLNLTNYKTLINFDSIKKQRNLLDYVNSKKISGIRFEAAGRLTKRLTASRSLFKIKHKGTLKNIQSSYKGIPSVVLKGYMKANIQYSNINSKTRNGSFGLKTWISCS